MTTPSYLEGLLKDQFGSIVDPQAESNTTREVLPFKSGTPVGDKFIFPIVMSDEQGATYSTGGELDTFNAAINGTSKEASVDAPDLAMIAELSYSTYLRSKNGGAAAYVDMFEQKVMSMLRSMGNRIEVSNLHGCGTGSTGLDDLGEVSGVISGSGTTYESCIIKFTGASFIHFLWDNSQNAKFDVLNSARTSRLVQDVVCVGVVDKNKCQVEFSCAHASKTTTVAAGHRFVYAGSYQKNVAGLNGMIQTDTTNMGIDPTDFPKHRGNRHPVGGVLTRAALFQAIAGLPATQSGKRQLVCWLDSFAFADLAEQTHAATTFFSKGEAIESKEVGTTELMFNAPKAIVRVIPCDIQKQGYGTIIDPSVCYRVGATDLTLKGLPGEDRIVLHLESKMGFQMRSLYQAAPVIEKMNSALILTGIASNGAFAPAG